MSTGLSRESARFDHGCVLSPSFSPPQKNMAQGKEELDKIDGMREAVGSVRESVKKALHDHACLAAYIGSGAANISSKLDSLHEEMSKGFENVLKTVEDERAAQDARDFKRRLDSLTVKDDRMCEDMMDAAQNQGRYPEYAKDQAKDAMESAEDLYIWAHAMLPDGMDENTTMTRQRKLQIMPYIVAMAYAVRVQVDAYMVKSHFFASDVDQKKFIKMGHRIVDKFMDLLQSAVKALVAETCLLEIAMDYQLPLGTYLTLMQSLCGSIKSLSSPESIREKAAEWDDGLSCIR